MRGPYHISIRAIFRDSPDALFLSTLPEDKQSIGKFSNSKSQNFVTVLPLRLSLPLYLSLSLSISLSLSQSLPLSLSLYLLLSLSLLIFLSLSQSLTLSLSISLSLSQSLTLSISRSLSIPLSLCPSIPIPISLSLSFSQCVYMSPSSSLKVFTGRGGRFVQLEDTIKGFQEILSGKLDSLPEGAFYMAGNIDEVKETAAKMATA